MTGQVGTRRTAAAVGGLAALAVLAVLALHARPQGDIARAAPHGVGAGAAVAAAAWLGWGRQAAVLAAATCTVLASAAVATHLVLLEPIPHAECRTLIQELGNAPCRSRAGVTWLGATGTAALAGAVAAWRARHPQRAGAEGSRSRGAHRGDRPALQRPPREHRRGDVAL